MSERRLNNKLRQRLVWLWFESFWLRNQTRDNTTDNAAVGMIRERAMEFDKRTSNALTRYFDLIEQLSKRFVQKSHKPHHVAKTIDLIRYAISLEKTAYFIRISYPG